LTQNLAAEILLLIQELHGPAFERALKDLRSCFKKDPDFIGNEFVFLYLTFLREVAAADILPECRVLALDFLQRLVRYYAEAVLEQIEEIVRFFFDMICHPQELISNEARSGIEKISETFGGNSIFTDACLMISLASLEIGETAKIRAFEMMVCVFPNSTQSFSLEGEHQLWEIAIQGITESEAGVRNVAFQFCKVLFEFYNQDLMMPGFRPEVVVEPFLAAIGREVHSEIVDLALSALCELCQHISSDEPSAAAEIWMFLWPRLELADDNKRTTIVCIGRTIARRFELPMNEFHQFCQAVVFGEGTFTRALSCECLKSLAFLTIGDLDFDNRILEIVVDFAAELSGSDYSESVVINEILRFFIEQKLASIQMALVPIVELLISKTELPSDNSMNTPLNEDIEINKILYFGRHEIGTRREFLHTLSDLLGSGLAPGLANYCGAIFTIVSQFVEDPFEMELVHRSFECWGSFASLAPFEVGFEMFLRLCRCIHKFLDIKQLISCISILSKCFIILSSTHKTQELCDAAVATFVQLLPKVMILLQRYRERSEMLLDVRESEVLYGSANTVVPNFITRVFEQFGDSSTIQWREAVPFDTSSVICVKIWSSYFEIVEQSDEVLSYIFSCLSLVGTLSGLVIATTGIERIRDFALHRIPLSEAAVQAALEALHGVIEKYPARSKIRRDIGITLVLLLSVYSDQCDPDQVILAMAECCPFRMDVIDLSAALDALLFVINRYWTRVLESPEILANTLLSSLMSIFQLGTETCQLRIRHFFQDVVPLENLMTGQAGLPLPISLKLQDIVRV
jgi:hypothetical protein